MREILFRGKRLDNGEWVQGYLTKMWGTFHIVDEHNENLAYPIDPETVCQFTGLTDKNGVKIWENDILQGNGNPKDLNTVVFGKLRVINIEPLGVVDDVIGWYYKPLETDTLSKAIPFCLPMPLTEYYIKRCEFEVIGNVFDNPELMEGGVQDE